MNKKKLILLAVGLAILIVLSGVASLFVLNFGNKDLYAGKIRVACIGDSITNGTYYPDDLWMLLGTNYTVGNFGVGGTTASLDSESPYMNTSAFQDAKEFQPNIVIIMLGTNDANRRIRPNNASFVADYDHLVGEFQALPSKPSIYLVKPPPVFCNGTTPSAEYFRDTVIPTIEQAANQTNLPIIDVYSALANSSSYFRDGVHPNEEGAVLIANVIYEAITSQNKT
jgi:lysophospholipase L1-like esterase